MISARRYGFAVSMILLASASLRGQGLEAGASAGLVNDVENHLRLDGFHHSDVNLWVGLETSENIVVRATVGSLRVQGSNAGRTPVGVQAPLPDLPDSIRYATLGVVYEFREEVFTSGLFAGFGGYRIEPDSVDPSLADFRDRRETVWGLHAGVEGKVLIVPRLSLLLRLTYHNIRSASGRSLLTADAGFAYRF